MALDIEMYRRTVSIPLKRSGEKIRRISVIDIHPEGATRTFVFVHGYGGDAGQWLYQLRYFGQTVRVIAPDLRGHGLSDDPASLPYTMDGLVDDLETVLEKLDVSMPFALIAHSFGGAVATEYALRHPDTISHLVLIGVPTRFIVRPILRRLMNIPDPLFSRLAKMVGVALYAPQHTLKQLHDRVMAPWRGGEQIQQLRVPTLIVLGQRDTVFLREHYEDVPRSIPDAHQVVIPVSAHLVQLERPDAVNRAIRRFVEPKQDKLQHVSRGNALAARLAEMPWLQHYDSEVPDHLPLPCQLVHEMFSNAARAFPNRAALIFFKQRMSYHELDAISNRFAHALRDVGVKTGDRVAVLLPNIPQCVIAFYGTLKAGAVLVLGSPLSNEEEIAYQLRDSGATVLLTLTSYRAMVERICIDNDIKQVIYTDVREYLPIRQRILIASLVEGSEPHRTGVGVTQVAQAGTSQAQEIQEAQSDSIDAGPNGYTEATPLPRTQVVTAASRSKSLPYRELSFQQLLRRQEATPMDSGTSSQHLALLQYTSGTSDMPKGVMLTHANLMANVTQTRHWLPDAQRGHEVMLGVLPLSHSYGITSCMNLSMALAGSLVLLPTRRIEQILEAIKEYRPTLFPGVPALYLAIANYPKVRSYGVSTIRTCISGSAPLPVEVQEAFEKLTRGRLVEGYGLTEASPVTHSNPLKGERRVGSIGIPLPQTNARVIDLKTGEPVPPDEVGELLVQGPQVMQGYWKMPTETAQVLQDGWLHTGDLARMDEDGFFTIVDRKKDLILAGAYNVYPRDVEEVLYEHPKVLEAAVVSTMAQKNGASSPLIKAVVVLKRGEKATADELLALCRERLDAYKVPEQIEFRTELPKNIVGKVLRRLLIEV
ncbi:MAG TPA: alpha/beta fold hydrolase [Ktedonobacteraceae bacterium]|nr:alpha/beta fold hydrolase [Ktedonobacteraceae bacterium]